MSLGWWAAASSGNARASGRRQQAAGPAARRDPESRSGWAPATARARRPRHEGHKADALVALSSTRGARHRCNALLGAGWRQVDGRCYGRINLAKTLSASHQRAVVIGIPAMRERLVNPIASRVADSAHATRNFAYVEQPRGSAHLD